MGDTFTVADAYLFTVLAWGKYVGMPLDPWPTLVAYNARIKERPTVKAAMAAERGK
jgi:glutathione S-transferase